MGGGGDSISSQKLLGDHRRRRGKRCTQLLLLHTRTLLLILIYYMFSIGLTFYQKDLFKDFPFPLTVVIVHLNVKFLLSGAWRSCSSCCSGKDRVSLNWRIYCTKVLPAGAAAGLDIGLSQWSLEFITVTLYTMSKSTALLFILFFAILFKLEEMRWSIVVLVILIAGGLLMFTYKYTQFNLFGFTLVMTASLLSGLRWTLSQILMQKSELGLSHPVDLVYHVQPWMALSLLPLAAAMEGTGLAGSEVGFNFKDIEMAALMWCRVLLGAFIAFCMEISEYYVVSCTSSLTFSISGVAKEIATLTLAVYYYHEHLSLINKAGLLLCVLGIALHVFFKARQLRLETASLKGPTSPPGTGDAFVFPAEVAQPLLKDSFDQSDEEMEMFSR
ncbi:solute carrier family 35 member C2-like isoform X2 [Hyalella azteca]|nr:solute carrier family 35 member C2-like isoform X2 [Hyalella azteca]